MLQPVSLTRISSRTIPTGLGLIPRAYSGSMRITKPHALSSGLNGLGATIQQESSVIGSSVAQATLFIPGVGPLISAAVTAATAVAVAIETLFSGCGQTCVQATSIANQVAGLLQQNLSGYLALPQPHYQSVQQFYLNIFDNTWAKLLQACGNQALGAAGQRCITDRQQGSCAYKTSPSGWSQNSAGEWTYTGAGPNGSGSTCWNWFVGYRDPIANDPTVVPDPVSSTVQNSDGSQTVTTVTIDPTSGVPTSTTSVTPPSILSSISSSVSSLPMPLLLGLGALVVIMMVKD